MNALDLGIEGAIARLLVIIDTSEVLVLTIVLRLLVEALAPFVARPLSAVLRLAVVIFLGTEADDESAADHLVVRLPHDRGARRHRHSVR